jgi:hypothetical protein
VQSETNPGPNRSWLVSLLLVPLFVLAAIFGFFVFLAVLGLFLFAVLVIGVRLWWLKRQMRRAGQDQVLEGEYLVVREHTRKDDEHRR